MYDDLIGPQFEIGFSTQNPNQFEKLLQNHKKFINFLFFFFLAPHFVIIS